VECCHLHPGNLGSWKMTSSTVLRLMYSSLCIVPVKSSTMSPELQTWPLDEMIEKLSIVSWSPTHLLAFCCASLTRVLCNKVADSDCSCDYGANIRSHTSQPSGRLAASSQKRTSATAADCFTASPRANYPPCAAAKLTGAMMAHWQGAALIPNGIYTTRGCSPSRGSGVSFAPLRMRLSP